jgi:hypothetical protein
MLKFCKTCTKQAKSTVHEKKWRSNNRMRLSRLSFSINETHPFYPKFADQLHKILQHDQLKQAIQANKAFSECQEGAILFPPTYKYNPFSSSFDTSPKARCPAWTDRILWFQKDDGLITNEEYYSMDIKSSSDHRPVCGKFLLHLSTSNGNL